jgi:hypothetical protein
MDELKPYVIDIKAPTKKSTGKKVAPAPYPLKGKQTTKAAANPLIEKTPKNFGVGKVFIFIFPLFESNNLLENIQEEKTVKCILNRVKI